MKIKSLGYISAENAPEGSLIAYPSGTLILVSEYSTTLPEYPFTKRNCYIVNSGEYYCGSMTEKGMLIELDINFECDNEDDE